MLSLVVVPVAALGIVIAIDRIFYSQATRACPVEPAQSARPRLQRILDGAVAGPSKLAPGATAYVSGPGGRWSGAAGVADMSTCARMPVDARMRLESVSKIYTATLILQLAQAGRLRVSDTVARWLPGLLPYGNRITIRQLLTMSSGLIDNNDFNNAADSVKRAYLARVKDAKLRAQLLTIAARVNKNPAAKVSETLWIRWAAWQPLLFTPGDAYHYSNIGYDILGLIAARAAGTPLPALYREQIFEPLGLHATAYDPQGPISGPHAHGYGIEPNGQQIDTTDWHRGSAPAEAAAALNVITGAARRSASPSSVGELLVEQDQVGRVHLEQRQAITGIGRLADPVALGLERAAQVGARAGVGRDDEHRGAAPRPARRAEALEEGVEVGPPEAAMAAGGVEGRHPALVGPAPEGALGDAEVAGCAAERQPFRRAGAHGPVTVTVTVVRAAGASGSGLSVRTRLCVPPGEAPSLSDCAERDPDREGGEHEDGHEQPPGPAAAGTPGTGGGAHGS